MKTPSEPEQEQLVMPTFPNTDASSKVSDNLIKKLKDAGFSVIDNRDTSSIIWVIYVGGKKDSFARIMSQFNDQFTLERRGAVATNNIPAWRVMTPDSRPNNRPKKA